MADLWISPSRVFDTRSLKSNLALRIEDGGVTNVCADDQVPKSARVQKVSGTIVPGYVDLQVNGLVRINEHGTA